MHRRRATLAATTLPLLAVLAAGCLGTTQPLDPGELGDLDPAGRVPDLRQAFAWEHEHTDPAEHAMAWNVERVAFLAPMVEGHDRLVHGELDVAPGGDVAFAGVGHGWVAYDVADPSQPRFLHYEPMPLDASCVGDVKTGPGEGILTVGAQCTTLSSEPVRGLVIYDVSDPAAPRVVSKGLPGTTCHMVDVAVVGGERYVYCAERTGPQAYRLVDLPGAPMTPVLLNPNLPLEPLAIPAHADQALQEFGPFGTTFLVRAHDMTTQPDPLTGAPIVVASQSYAGVRILDGSDPALSRVLGTWDGAGADDYSWIHTAMAYEHEGRRIVVAITENVVETPPRLWVLDWTDWARPEVLVEHDLADQPTSHGLSFSLHNFQVVDKRLYIAAYHAGVWVLDLTDPAAPVPLGLAMPNEDQPYAGGDGSFWGIGNDWVTQVWDVVVKDGHMLVSDMRSGLYVYRFAEDPVGEAARDHDSWG